MDNKEFVKLLKKNEDILEEHEKKQLVVLDWTNMEIDSCLDILKQYGHLTKNDRKLYNSLLVVQEFVRGMFFDEEEYKKFNYGETIEKLESRGINCDSTTLEGELVCDWLDNNYSYDEENEEDFYTMNDIRDCEKWVKDMKNKIEKEEGSK